MGPKASAAPVSFQRRSSWMLVLLLAATPCKTALADDSPAVVRAREEFNEGVTLMTANDWAGALAKFKDVSHVKMNANVAFNMGECEDHLGLLVEALGDYRLAAAKAEDGSAPKVAQSVDGRIAALGKRIAHLNLQRDEPKPNPAAKLQLDGIDVAPAEVGTRIAVNPGARVITVVLHDRVVHTEKVTLEEGADKELKITIPEPSEGDDSGGSDVPPSVNGPSIPGIVVTTIGGASLVTGLAFIGLRQKAIGDLNTACNGTRVCPDTAKGTYDNGRTYTGVAEVMIPVGVVGLATGIALLATHGKKAPPKTGQLTWSLSAPRADGPGASLVVPF